MIASIIFLISAAICNAVCDTLAHHFVRSIFNSRKLDDKFWNPSISWSTAPYIPLTKYKVDAWHLFKSGMICFLVGSIVTAWQSEKPFFDVWWFYLMVYVFLGIGWNMVFNLFYNHILLKKK